MLLPAAIDGELRLWRRRTLDRHLAACAACRREMATTATMLDVLGGLAMEAPVPARLEQDTLRRVRLAAEEPEASRRWWARLPVPALAFATAALLAIVIVRGRDVPLATPAAKAVPGTRRQAAEPVARTTARPAQAVARAQPKPIVSDPPAELPPELAAAPDLFMNLPILRHLEKLEHFDAIETTTLDEAPAAPGGDGERSSG
jgi:anti-sigma factor RsiW